MPNIAEGIAKLVDKADKSSKNRSVVGANVTDNWRYIDFIDPSTGKANLPLEYLYGARGFITGRVIKLEAEKAAGKSSSIFMAYAMAQLTGGAWSVHYDTEEAPPPPDFMAHLGCDPREILLEHPEELESCMKSIKDRAETIRKELDKEKQYPIIFGLDSVSGLGVNVDNSGKKGPKAKEGSNNSKQLSYHARKFSEWFREELKILQKYDALLIASAQLKENIGAGMFASAEEGKTTLAGKTFGYHATWVLRMQHSRWWHKDKGDLGEVISCQCLKNKVNAPKRKIKFYLKSTEISEPGEVGWDFAQATLDLLTGKSGNAAPFPDELTQGGAYYSMPQLNNGKGMMKNDFVDAFLENEDLVMRAREAFRVRGFGFAFEKDYLTHDDEDAKDS